VRCDSPRQTGEPDSRFEPLLYRCNRLAVELNKAGGNELAILPATQVSEQLRRYGCWCLSFLGNPLADSLAIEDAALKVDERSAKLGIRRR
jgi:hypothetical protein